MAINNQGNSGEIRPTLNNKFFNQDRDIKTLRLLQRSYDININSTALSASLYAGSANTYAATLQPSGLSGTISAYDSSGTPTNISTTGLFQQMASFYFGRNDSLIPNSSNTYGSCSIFPIVSFPNFLNIV